MTPAEVAGLYSARRAIEDANRNLKQCLGVQNPQSWVGGWPTRRQVGDDGRFDVACAGQHLAMDRRALIKSESGWQRGSRKLTESLPTHPLQRSV